MPEKLKFPRKGVSRSKQNQEMLTPSDGPSLGGGGQKGAGLNVGSQGLPKSGKP